MAAILSRGRWVNVQDQHFNLFENIMENPELQ